MISAETKILTYFEMSQNTKSSVMRKSRVFSVDKSKTSSIYNKDWPIDVDAKLVYFPIWFKKLPFSVLFNALCAILKN